MHLLIVICRIGSLEMEHIQYNQQEQVICRIGSLEMFDNTIRIQIRVICRIGSLEKNHPTSY